jgi:predicted adenine nucleotide alpha hydrolase (AANH) superfamily ATPase/VanZ family protein
MKKIVSDLKYFWNNSFGQALLLGLWITFICWCLETPLQPNLLPANLPAGTDILPHFLLFVVLGWLSWRWFSSWLFRRTTRFSLALFLTTLFALITEIVQLSVPTRGFSWTDWAVDVCGIVTALLVIYWLYERKPALLMHLCCGPCAASAVLGLKKDYYPVLLFANSNIDTKLEFKKRWLAAKRLAAYYQVPLLKVDYRHDAWLQKIAGHETAPERGSRCLICYRQRLEEAAQVAKRYGLPLFTTSLTTSPHKNRPAIMAIAQAVASEQAVDYLNKNFGEGSGYQESIKVSKEIGLYRQNYCGCEFAKGHLARK